MAIPFLSDIRLPSSGKVYLWTGHNDNFLKYDLWQASASAGMTIKNIANSGNIYFQTNSTTALTLDSSQNVIANAFTGRLQGAVTSAPDATIWCVSGQYTNWGIFYNEGSPDKIEFKASGTVTSSIALDNGDITTSGNIYLNNNKTIFGKNTSGSNYGLLTITSGNVVKLGAYAYTSAATQIGLGDNGKFLIGTEEALSIDNNKNATFAGDIILSTDADILKAGTNPFRVFTNGTLALSVSASQNATFAGHIIPTSDGTQDLGTTNSKDFRSLYIRDIDIYNQRFRMSSTGTTAVLEDHSSVGDGFLFRHLGAEILRLGNDTSTTATFAGNLDVNGTEITVGNNGSIFAENNVRFKSSGAAYIDHNTTSQSIKFRLSNSSSLDVIPFEITPSYLVTAGNFMPGTDSTYNIGSNTNRFSNVYADTLHGTVALATQANNLQSFDDRDIAPEDLSFSDDLKLFFAEKTGIEGGTVGSDWQDLLILSSYVDSSGGKLNALALDKSTHRILHYNASHNATNWGTAKELAYTSDFVKRTGGSSTSMSGDLHIIAGAPKIYLQDNTDDDDQQIVFRNNSGGDDYKITTQDFTSAGTGDGLFIGSETTDPVKLVTNDTIALAIDSSQHISLPGAYLTLKDINSHAQIEASSSSLMIKAVNIQAQGNLIPDGNGNRNLGASNRYWAETYTNGVTSGGNIVINSNTPVLTLGVINSSTGNAKVQFYSKNSGTSNGFAIQYNKDTSIDRLEFIDGGGTAAFQFHNGGNAEFEGSLTASQINTGQGATEVHLMNQNLRTTDDVTFDDLTVTGNLTITGDINSYNVTDLDITDKTITLGKGQDEGHSGGSGLIVDGSSASILWDESNDTWDFNKGIYITGNDGNVNLDGNAAIIFDNTNNNNGWYIRNGGSNAATLQFGLGTSPGSNIKHTFAGDGSVSFATYVNAATGFRMASGQAIDFISTNIGYNSIERNTSVGGLQINTGDTASMNILDNGNVGINSTSPEEKLTIATGNIQFRKNAQAANTSLGFLGWKNTYATGTHVAAKIDVLTRNESSSAHDYTNLVFYTWNGYNSLSEKMRIADDGNVGIGTNSPSHLLSIGTSGNASGKKLTFYLGSSDGNYAGIGAQRGETNLYCSSEIRFINESNSSGDGAMSFNTGSNSLNERMRITSAGNVGIGETNPSHKITAPSGTNGRVARLGNLEITTQSGTYTGSSIEVTGSNSFITYRSTLGHKFVTRTSGGGNTLEAMTIVPDTGRVGIGETSVDAKLHISDGTTPNIKFERPGTKKWAMGISGTDFIIDDVNDNLSTHVLKLAADNTATFAGKITTAGGVNYTGGTIAQATTVLHTNNIVYNIGGSNGIIISNADYSDRYYITNADHRWEVGSADAMRLNSTGLGIGTTSPAEKLEVNGSIKLGSMKLENISAGGRIGFNRNTSNGAIYNSSYEAFQIQANGAGYLETQVYNSSGGYIGSMALTDDVKLGIGTNSPTYKLSVAGAISGSGFVTYTKSYGSLNSTGNAVAGITAAANGNGSSCGFTFTCFGHTGAYQRIVYSCYNSSGTWYAKKVIDEGTNQLDVAASANGSTITFTFKATSSTMSYTPRVKVEAEGQNINSTYA